MKIYFTINEIIFSISKKILKLPDVCKKFEIVFFIMKFAFNL